MEQLPPSNPIPPQPPTQNLNRIELLGHTRLGLLILGLLSLAIFGKMCGNKKITDNVPGEAVKIKQPSSVKLVQPSSRIIHQYIPPEGSITITPKDPSKSIDDLVRIHYQEMGFTFEPGLEFSGNLYYSYGLDAKLLYAYRFGVGAGLVVGSNVRTIISPSVFISYRLDQVHLRNTEALVTYVPLAKIPFGLGLRINF